jgi:Flp pilus assembly pilin Flp
MLSSVANKIRLLARDERGLSTVEYVVLLVLIVAMAVAAWNTFGKSVNSKLTDASGSFDGTVQGGAVTGGQGGEQGAVNPGSGISE